MTRRTRKELEEFFEKSGINFSRPGFYDTPEFIEVEKKSPALLIAYAEYIESLHFDDEYILRARACATEVAAFMFSELVKDGRQGACIDASGVVQKILDREGVWSYLVCGGVRIQFPDSSQLPDTFFRPVVHPGNPAQTGHAWLCVPPFKIVDITLPLQPYPWKVRPYFDGIVTKEQFSSYTPVAGDLYENDFVELIVGMTGKRPALEDLSAPMRRFMDSFPAFNVEYGRLKLKYIPTKTNPLAGELKEMRNLRLSGMYPAELYNKFLKSRELARTQ